MGLRRGKGEGARAKAKGSREKARGEMDTVHSTFESLGVKAKDNRPEEQAEKSEKRKM